MAKNAKTENKNATEASYKISYLIALTEEGRTIRDILIIPCEKDIEVCKVSYESN
jgi:hypothetical protein